MAGTLCWVACFWWMHRISSRQNDLLQKLCEQGKRIEKLSKVEHDLIKQVHPQVNEIKQGVEEMIATAKEIQEDIPVAANAKSAR
jgi:ribosomal protein L17